MILSYIRRAMNSNDYILKEIKALTLTSTVKSAQKLCEKLPITHIPVVENGKLIGSFAESDIQTIENKNTPLSEYSYLLDSFFADDKASVLELLKLFANHDCNMIPVLDKEKNYIGYYELNDILEAFSASPFLLNESVTLIVEKNEKDYSMSQIAQLIEINKGKILGMYISHKTIDITQVTLKVVSAEMNEIIQAFRRYNYKIITEHKDDFYLEDLKDRSDYLQKYLDL